MEPATDSEKLPNDPKLDIGPGQSDESTTVSPVIDDVETHLQADLNPKESNQQERREVRGWKWVVVVLAIYSSQFLFALDQTIVANVQPAIVEQFKSGGRLTWVSVPSHRRRWNKLGMGQSLFSVQYQRTYVATISFFEVGSAICGAAPDMDSLIERPVYVGGAGLVWGIGTVLGPIIGGAFTDSFATWRWSFYINLCVGAVCAPVYLFMLPNKDPHRGISLANRAREFDHLGTILLIGAFFSGVMAVSFGGVMYPWNSGKIIGHFCCSAMLFVLFGVQQVYALFTTPARHIFPVKFIKSRTILILFAMTAADGTSIFLSIYMTPLYFQFSRGDGALESCVRLLPFIMLMMFATILNGAFLSKMRYYMPWYLGGGVLVVIGGALMFTITGITLSLAIANAVFLNKSEDGIMAILPNTPIAKIQQTITGAGSTLFDNLSADDRQRVWIAGHRIETSDEERGAFMTPAAASE
ncbi:Major facilitator superfamily domain general substrate transporter [Penicillium macrosclerotiorum]|uniref:Major facilitator superfamily domain general substrate transporter n=1 Tax=Penicillium macrosclerotiorum TaxID=303699 RepID=UPI0025482D9C|nr:Major facilitator superfamily domain general substrate transporter [Penicillium macrosclerotiorum]KAJ5678744.1 Major facilitator superfamily domain general substrate transporter [Penicillium macrosclerotiorum]